MIANACIAVKIAQLSIRKCALEERRVMTVGELFEEPCVFGKEIDGKFLIVFSRGDSGEY
jgi:hypothetical protein